MITGVLEGVELAYTVRAGEFIAGGISERAVRAAEGVVVVVADRPACGVPGLWVKVAVRSLAAALVVTLGRTEAAGFGAILGGAEATDSCATSRFRVAGGIAGRFVGAGAGSGFEVVLVGADGLGRPVPAPARGTGVGAVGEAVVGGIAGVVAPAGAAVSRPLITAAAATAATRDTRVRIDPIFM